MGWRNLWVIVGVVVALIFFIKVMRVLATGDPAILVDDRLDALLVGYFAIKGAISVGRELA